MPLCYDTVSTGVLVSQGTTQVSMYCHQHFVLQVIYDSQPFCCERFFLNGLGLALWHLQEICHVLSLHQEAQILGASICPCWLSLYVLFVNFKAKSI